MAHTKTEWWLTLNGQVAQTSQEYSSTSKITSALNLDVILPTIKKIDNKKEP